jgi:hypothetical protein
MHDDKIVMNNVFNTGNGKDDKIQTQSRESDDIPWYICLLSFLGLSSCC